MPSHESACQRDQIFLYEHQKQTLIVWMLVVDANDDRTGLAEDQVRLVFAVANSEVY